MLNKQKSIHSQTEKKEKQGKKVQDQFTCMWAFIRCTQCIFCQQYTGTIVHILVNVEDIKYYRLLQGSGTTCHWT